MVAASVVLAALLLVGVTAQQLGKEQEAVKQPDVVELQAFPLTQLKGCAVAPSPKGFELPEGLLEQDCMLPLQLVPDDPQVFVFSIADNVEMSVVLTLAVQGGTASMSVWYPGSSVENPPDLVQSELFTSPASSEGWISIPTDVVVTQPGQYILSVTAFSGSPTATLSVTTPGSTLQLAPAELELLRDMTSDCCKNADKPEDSPYCYAIAPQSLAKEHDWTADMCHIAPSSCNAKGQLTRLALPGLGLKCPSFPAQLAKLPALTRLDLSGNNFAQSTVEEVAAVVSGMKGLEELSMGSTGISGSLSCDLLTPNMQVLDIAYNQITGSLPSCFVNSLTQLFVPGNELSGPLPALAATSTLATLYANQQKGAGLTGTIPVSIHSLSSLSFVNLAGNSLGGALPGLPASLRLLNISGNGVSGRLSSLPKGMWQLDVSDNKLSGSLPQLAGLADLEQLVINNNPMEGSLPVLPGRLRHLEAMNAGLSGPLPPLPSSLRRLDVSDNSLTGLATKIDVGNMEVMRAANNSLTGSVPASAVASSKLFLLDLHSNKLSGSLPDGWHGARMQMIMLEDNDLTGTIPASLATLPNLGVLRLGHNKLSGSLKDFAAALPDPAVAAAAAAANDTASSKAVSRLFDLNVTSNQLTGPVPDQLGYLGVFNPNITIIVPGADGAASIAPRGLDLSGNKLSGPWPQWLLKAVPSTTSVCGCSISIDVDGPAMRLACPTTDSLSVSDYMWQVAAEQRYTCYSAKEQSQEQLLDFLVSPANGLDKIDTSSVARGDGGGLIGAGNAASKRAGVIAGAVVGVLLGLAALSVLAYFVVYKRFIKPQAATAFKKFQDDPAAAAAAGAGGAGAGGSIDMQSLPTAGASSGGARPI